jgi:hypothetical protein
MLVRVQLHTRDPGSRSAVLGSRDVAVWDVRSLRVRRTRCHYTFSIHSTLRIPLRLPDTPINPYHPLRLTLSIPPLSERLERL